MFSVLITAFIFGYVVYVLWKVPKHQVAGKCASCELNKKCTSACKCDLNKNRD